MRFGIRNEMALRTRTALLFQIGLKFSLSLDAVRDRWARSQWLCGLHVVNRGASRQG